MAGFKALKAFFGIGKKLSPEFKTMMRATRKAEAKGGALIGGAIGAGSGAIAGYAGDKDHNLSSAFKGAITGGLAGAGLGAGMAVGGSYMRYNKGIKNLQKVYKTPKLPSAPKIQQIKTASRKKKNTLGSDLAIGGAVGVGTNIAAVLGTVGTGHHFLKKMPKVTEREVFKDFLKKNPKIGNVVHIPHFLAGSIASNKFSQKSKIMQMTMGQFGPFVATGSHIITGPKNMKDSVLLHELGHLVDMSGKKGASRMKRYLISKYFGVPAGVALGVAMSKNDKTRAFAPLAPLATYAPVLRGEFAASKYAVKELIKKHGLGKGLLKSLPLGIAFASYAALPGGLSYGFYRYNKKQKAKSGR